MVELIYVNILNGNVFFFVHNCQIQNIFNLFEVEDFVIFSSVNCIYFATYRYLEMSKWNKKTILRYKA